MERRANIPLYNLINRDKKVLDKSVNHKIGIHYDEGTAQYENETLFRDWNFCLDG